MMKLSDYFKKAQEGGWALGQFNISELGTILIIVRAAQKLKSPVIVGVSERSSKPLGLAPIFRAVKRYKDKTGLPVFLHLDHARTLSYIRRAIKAGFDSVHFDGSLLSLDRNIKETKKIKNYAKRFGVLVEGEIDIIGGKLTDIVQAQKFVRVTGVDGLAADIGTEHGMLRMTKVNFSRLKKIKKAVGSIPLVMHGGSGVSASQNKRAIKAGIVKINISTALRKAKSAKAKQKVVENKLKLFGSINKI